MRSWGIDEFACQAGLFHAAYDTVDYVSPTAPMMQTRSQLRSLIGQQAEELVWQFSKLHKLRFFDALAEKTVASRSRVLDHNSRKEIHLLHLTFANFIEQIGELDPRQAEKRIQEFSVLAPALNSNAREQLQKLKRDEAS